MTGGIVEQSRFLGLGERVRLVIVGMLGLVALLVGVLVPTAVEASPKKPEPTPTPLFFASTATVQSYAKDGTLLATAEYGEESEGLTIFLARAGEF